MITRRACGRMIRRMVRAWPETERVGGFGLAGAHGKDACSHDFGDEGARIGGKGQPECREFRCDVYSALQVEPAHLGRFQSDRTAEEEKGEYRQPDNQRKPGPPDRERLPGSVLARPCPAEKEDRCRNPDDNAQDHDRGSILEDERWDPYASVVQIHRFADGNAVRTLGNDRRMIPRRCLQEDGNVARELDIGSDNAADEKILGQPQDAGQETDERGRNDAKNRYKDGIRPPTMNAFP